MAGHTDNGKSGRIGKLTSISSFFLSLCLAGKRPFLWLIGNGVLRDECDQSFKEDAFFEGIQIGHLLIIDVMIDSINRVRITEETNISMLKSVTTIILVNGFQLFLMPIFS